MNHRALIVTHHAPDLDAIGAVWLLKRFDAQHYATAKVAFVNPGQRITLEKAEELGSQLHEATHVDTGLGRFDHHQPERGGEHISATSLVYDHVCSVHPDLKKDQPLKEIAEFVTEIDHFGEVHWHDADSPHYSFMIHELIHGAELVDPHNDESQLHFGMQCLDHAYGVLTQYFKADEILQNKGIEFELPAGKCLGVRTRNDDTIKLAQKRGFILVVRKDSERGNVRIKARPDSELDLTALHQKIIKADQVGSWYLHASGKMLLNGSRKHRNQKASPLKLDQIIDFIKELYGAE